MIVTEITEQRPFLFREDVSRDRTKPHVSGLIRQHILDTDPKKSYPEWEDMTAEERRDTLMAWELGFMWEDALAREFAGRCSGIPAAPREVDGIIMTPDRLWLPDKEEPVRVPENGDMIEIDEYKATKYSMKNMPENNMRWMMQTKSYCYGFKTTVANMLILYIMGDYGTTTRGMTYKAFRFEFSAQELAENWAVMLALKEKWYLAHEEQDHSMDG